MSKIVIFFVLSLMHDFGIRQCDAAVTPEVTILEESPSRRSGRVIENPDKSIVIKGFTGETVVLQCEVFNMPENARIIWKKLGFGNTSIIETINDGLMSRDMSKWKVGQGKQTNSIRLEIMSLDEQYRGLYTCECYYEGIVEPAKAQRILLVYETPRIVKYQSSYDTTVSEGDKTIVQCNAVGIPSPVIYWRRTGGESSIIRNFGVQKVGNNITFDSILPGDAGQYVCFAQNEIDTTFWKIKLIVQHKPKLRVFPEKAQLSQKANCNFQLLCVCSANPKPTTSNIQWASSTAGTLKEDGKRIRIRYLDAANNNVFYSVSFEPIYKSDFAATYTCTATNSYGTDSISAIITESAEPRVIRTGQQVCSGGHRVLGAGIGAVIVLLLSLLVSFS